MTYVYETKTYSIWRVVSETEAVGLATDLKISKTSDGNVDEFTDKYNEFVGMYGEQVVFEETFPSSGTSYEYYLHQDALDKES